MRGMGLSRSRKRSDGLGGWCVNLWRRQKRSRRPIDRELFGKPGREDDRYMVLSDRLVTTTRNFSENHQNPLEHNSTNVIQYVYLNTQTRLDLHAMNEPTDVALDEQKFADLVLYIAHRCRNDQRFGSVKLCKILYYCDFEAHRRLLKPITGATYVKMDQGPVPRGLYEARRSLIRGGDARVEIRPVQSYHEERLVPTRDEVQLGTSFSADESNLIDEIIERLRPMTGKEASDLSHGEFGWQSVEFYEPIPYATSLIARRDDPRLVKWLAARAA